MLFDKITPSSFIPLSLSAIIVKFIKKCITTFTNSTTFVDLCQCVYYLNVNAKLPYFITFNHKF